MVIAVLALLGVDLVAILIVLVFVLSRKRWVKRQPGAFQGSVRVVDGHVEGISPKWRRGYGHWVSDVLVWTKGPFLFRNELVPVDGLGEQRTGVPGEVKHLGRNPTVVPLSSNGGTLEVAAHSGDAPRLLGPFR